MKAKIVYSLVSDKTDLYFQQLLLSLHSLKIYNPNRVVALITEIETYNYISEKVAIKELVDEIIIVPNKLKLNKVMMSRYIKTSLRNLIDGDFLFIDTDTIICDNLDEIDNFNFELGAVFEKHTKLKFHNNKESIKEWCKKVDLELKDEDYYINSGVLYVKDTISNRRLFTLWNENWLQNKNNNFHLDQPSLNKILYNFKDFKSLDGIWNCQIIFNGLKYLNNAKIIHYFASMHPWNKNSKSPFLLGSNEILLNIRENNNVIPKDIHESLLKSKSMFREDTLLLSDCDYLLNNTTIYKIINKFFYKNQNLFFRIESILNNIKKLLK